MMNMALTIKYATVTLFEDTDISHALENDVITRSEYGSITVAITMNPIQDLNQLIKHKPSWLPCSMAT